MPQCPRAGDTNVCDDFVYLNFSFSAHVGITLSQRLAKAAHRLATTKLNKLTAATVLIVASRADQLLRSFTGQLTAASHRSYCTD